MKMDDHQIREVAETLVASFSPTQPRSISHSVNLIAEELAVGQRRGGSMSSVRRFFCLLVTFDLLFTALVWLICVVLHGATLPEIFNSEVVHYSIRTSLFDIVMVAACRFIVLLLFYALLYINNWSVIALSTGCTCAFLIAKVFVYNWVEASEPVYRVFLILTSFTLSWGEAWFLDFRVLPQEQRAEGFLAAYGNPSVASERAPLLAGVRRGPQTCGESTADWFSPIDSPDTSPRPRRPGEPRAVILTTDKIEEYQRLSAASVASCWSLLGATGWKLEKRGSVKGDLVESISTKEYGKVFRFTGSVECPARWMFEDLRDNFVTMPEWNPTILRSELIKVLSPGVDLTYQITAGGGGGLISARDFVMLRRVCPVTRAGEILPCDGDAAPAAYMSCGVSVECPGYPPVGDYVRGVTKVGCWVMRPVADKTSSGRVEEKCIFQWLFSCDLKGRMPPFVIDAAFATVMLENVQHIRKHASEARDKGLF